MYKMKFEYIKKIIDMSNSHFKKYGKRKMTLKKLDAICEC
jgi:hypothetical protein